METSKPDSEKHSSATERIRARLRWPSAGPPVFYARGSADQVVAPYLLEHTSSWLPGHSSLTAPVYPGLGHSISADMLNDLRTFLDERYAGDVEPLESPAI